LYIVLKLVLDYAACLLHYARGCQRALLPRVAFPMPDIKETAREYSVNMRLAARPATNAES
jgi:hypothetical protein